MTMHEDVISMGRLHIIIFLNQIKFFEMKWKNTI